MIGSNKYQLSTGAATYYDFTSKIVDKSRYPHITNPCSEISLNAKGGYCVHGDTRILHKHGYDKIKDVVGKQIEVYNGKKWSRVTPFKTGENQKLLRIYISDGSYLDCTEYHEFLVKNGRQAKRFFEIKAKDLNIGHILPAFRIPFDCDGDNLENAYTYGAFLGDGSYYERNDVNSTRYEICLYDKKHNLPIPGNHGKLDANNGISVNVSYLNHDKMKSLKDLNELPGWIFKLNRESLINFIKGWLDTDGCYSGDKVGGFKITSSSEFKIRGLQLLLRRIGISFASIRVAIEAGTINNFGVRQNDLWECYIPKDEANLISGYRVKTPYNENLAKIVRQQKIEKIEKLEGVYDTYCFEEQEEHCGVFNNILTKQCVIGDIVPFFCNSLGGVKETAKLATRFLIRTNLMNAIYADEVKRTNRIGTGMTGVHEFAWKFFGYGFRDLIDENKSQMFWDFIGELRQTVENEAASYSQKLGLNTPHTCTTMKPSGSISKLYALTEGAHLPARRFYLRWVQFQNNDPLIEQYREEGYPIKPLKTYPNVSIIGFPTLPLIATLGMKDKLVTASEATPEEQYKWLMLLEKYWLAEGNNQISYTMKISTEKYTLEEFRETFKKYQSQIRCCSVLPMAGENELKSMYEYLPEENISEQEFKDIQNRVNKKNDVGFSMDELMCEGGACPL